MPQHGQDEGGQCWYSSWDAAKYKPNELYSDPGNVFNVLQVIRIETTWWEDPWLVSGHQVAHPPHGQRPSMGNDRVGNLYRPLECDVSDANCGA